MESSIDNNTLSRKRSADEARLRNLELARKKFRPAIEGNPGADTPMMDNPTGDDTAIDLRKYVTLANRINYLENFVVDQEKYLHNATEAIDILRLRHQERQQQQSHAENIPAPHEREAKPGEPGILARFWNKLSFFDLLVGYGMAAILVAIPILLEGGHRLNPPAANSKNGGKTGEDASPGFDLIF